jgi:hypothetical protein
LIARNLFAILCDFAALRQKTRNSPIAPCHEKFLPRHLASGSLACHFEFVGLLRLGESLVVFGNHRQASCPCHPTRKLSVRTLSSTGHQADRAGAARFPQRDRKWLVDNCVCRGIDSTSAAAKPAVPGDDERCRRGASGCLADLREALVGAERVSVGRIG